MRNIPIVAVPNQSLSVTLGGSRWDIRLRVACASMVADIARDGDDVVRGQRVVAGEPIIPYSYLSGGDAINFGVVTPDDEYPWWEKFGDTHRLVTLP